MADNDNFIEENYEDDMFLEINSILSLTNIAEELDDDTLADIGYTVVREFDADESSREEWVRRNEKYMKIALQVEEKKNFPWPNAANVKYPLMTTASVQFAARAYPSLINGLRIVKGVPVGMDTDGEKRKSAIRIEKHMSYQIIEQMPDWEEDMDKLTMILPLVGCAFKKTYHNPNDKVNVSELVRAQDLVVDYYTKSLETAARKTHVLEMTSNDIHERVMGDIFLDVDLIDMSIADHAKRNKNSDKIEGKKQPHNINPASIPRIILEQHRFWDLDGDGYEEPYICTVDYKTKQVLRIVPRFDADDVEYTENGEVIKIKPTEYFTKYSFIPNPDGGFYDVGFGMLLASINETANTLLNQLIDAGTLSNLQSGFLSRGIRIKGGKARFRPGEWKTVLSSGIDLQKGIYPLPVREPSAVLFQLLGTLIESGERLSSVTDMLVGENPGQNQPATTTLAVIEQGLKVYTAIYKRIHRAMSKEFKKIHRLNSMHMSPEEYFSILDDPQADPIAAYKKDYGSGITNVVPYADANVSSEEQRLIKAQVLLEIATTTGRVNIDFAVRNLLEAQNQPNIDQAMNVPDPQPSWEQTLEEKKFKHQVEKDKEEIDISRMRVESQNMKDEATAILNAAKAVTEDLKLVMESLRKEATTTTKSE